MTELPTRMSERFTLAELIGRGTCSSVFRARDELLDRDVALKIFPVTDDPRVAREVSLMASLDHPALVPVYDVGEVDGRAFVVMALFDGGNLADRLADGPLALTEALLTGSAVADALAHVHRAGVLHRDVIPRNVLFDADGRAHLSDFGVAFVADAPRITDTGIVVGSAPYLAPEQVRGEHVGPTADVYALGLVTLEALTGTRAYPGAPLEAAQARLEHRPTIPAELPDDVVTLLEAMTADDPAARPDAEAVCRRMRQAALASEMVDGDPRAALFADPAVTDLTAVAPAPRGSRLRHARRGTMVLGAATAAIMLASGVVIAATGPARGGVAATTPPDAALSAPALAAPAVPAPLLGAGSDSGDAADASQAADAPESESSGPTREQRASVVADSSPERSPDSSPGTAAVRRAEPDVRTTEADRPAEPAAPRSTDPEESPRSASDDTTTTSPSPSSSSESTSSSSPTSSSSSPTSSSRDHDRDRDRDRTAPREDRDDTATSEPTTTEKPRKTEKSEKSGKDGKDAKDGGPDGESDGGSSSTDGSQSTDDAGRSGLVEALAQPVTRLLGQ